MQSRLGSGAVQLGLGFLLASSALESGAQRSPSLDRSQVEREVMGLFDRWMEAFNRLDFEALERTFHFPHYRLAGGEMEVLNRPGEMNQEELKRYLETIGWHHSSWDRRRIVHMSDAKVHVDTKFTRYRKDGSVIASHELLCILTREEGQWGVKMRSAFARIR